MDKRLEAPVKTHPNLLVNAVKVPEDDSEKLRWGKLRNISSKLYGLESQHGKPTVIECSPQFIAIGTAYGSILVFYYSQEEVFVLTISEHQRAHKQVVALSICQNERGIVAAFKTGVLAVWDFENIAEPLYIVESPAKEGILYVDFYGPKLSSPIIVAYAEGDVWAFHSAQLLLLKQIASRQIRPKLPPSSKDSLLAATSFKVNSTKSKEPLILGTISTKELVLSTVHSPTTSDAFKRGDSIHFPRLAADAGTATGYSGAFAYNAVSTQLAMAFSDRVLVFKLGYSHSEPSKAARNSVCLKSSLEKAYTASASISVIHWVTDTVLALVLVVQQVVFIDLNTMSQFLQQDLTPYTLRVQEYPQTGLEYLETDVIPCDSFASTIKFQNTSIFLLGNYEVLAAQPVQWADQLMTLLNAGEPARAVLFALELWRSGGASAVLAGLPSNAKARQVLVKAAFPDIILTALRFHTMDGGSKQCSELLQVAVSTIAETNLDLLPQILEIVEPNEELLRVFCQAVINMVFTTKLRFVDAHVAQVILSRVDDASALEMLALELPLEVLDLDWLAREANARELPDLEMYILSYGLCHWTAPLSKTFGERRYAYLVYTITGRTWPLGNTLGAKADGAQKSMLSSLFHGSEYRLLLDMARDDPLKYFQAFNEILEESWLNVEDKKSLSRQSIVDTLCGVVDQLRGEKTVENIQDIMFFCAVFLARNYAKFSQYLVLSDSRLQAAALQICKYPGGYKAEANFALMALFSVYLPENTDELLDSLRDSQLWLVLELIYSRSDDWRMALVCALKEKGDHPDFWQCVAKCIRNDRANSLEIIMDNIEALTDRSASEFAALIIEEGINSIYDYLPNCSWETQLALLDKIYQQIYQQSLLRPPIRVGHQYLTLLAQHNKDAILKCTQRYFSDPSQVQIPAVIDNLLENNCIDVVCYLLSRRDRNSEAMIYLTNYMRNNSVEQDPKQESLAEMGANLCIQAAKTDLESSEDLWLKLILCLLEINADARPTFQILVSAGLTNGVVVKVVKKMLQSEYAPTFSYLTSDVFVAISLQQKFVESLHAILARDLSTEMNDALNQRLRGWTIAVDGECEVCGKRVVGLGIESEEIYRIWEHKLRGKPVKFTDQHENTDALVVFACSHTYHLKCLKRMSPEFRCISQHPLTETV